MTAPVTLIQNIENQFIRKDPLPDFRPGDTVKVWVKIREGQKTRLQAFEGVCIRRTGGANRATFTVRKISYGVGVERIFAVNSPNIEKVELLARGRVHQSRLYYLRALRGKAARIKERAYDKNAASAAASGEGEVGEDGVVEKQTRSALRKKRRAAKAEAASAKAGE